MTNEFKVALVGDTAVGKTCIATRFTTNTFNKQEISSNSAAFYKKTVSVQDQYVKFQIWDTAGQECYKSLAPMYYRSAIAVLIVFDLSRPKTFEEVRYWVNEVQQKGSQNTQLILLGNKVDIEARAVSQELGKQFAKQVGAKYYECSAATGEGVQQLFEEIASNWLNKKTASAGQQNLGLVEDLPQKKCC
ncbi:Rab2a [Hexamita inflata]|uniref:Rab2a n=2 Tax=Hexamita inflata TaxID=28002 RepID=A0AA86QTV6_9EUKA|nr:Rab2a [Hexamita inflata]